jgi:hypothetical protein
MKPTPDELRARAAECQKKAGRAYPESAELWSQIAAEYSSLAEEAEKVPTFPVEGARG